MERNTGWVKRCKNIEGEYRFLAYENGQWFLEHRLFRAFIFIEITNSLIDVEHYPFPVYQEPDHSTWEWIRIKVTVEE